MTVIWCMFPEMCSVTDRIFCHFGQCFAHLFLKNPKNQNFENMKKMPGDIIILHKCTKIMIIWYTVPEIWRVTDLIVIFHFGLFFALFPFFQKNEKKAWRYHHITHVYQKLWLDGVRFLKNGAPWTDGRTEGKKWHKEVGAPPKITQKGTCNFPLWFAIVRLYNLGKRSLVYASVSKFLGVFRF